MKKIIIATLITITYALNAEKQILLCDLGGTIEDTSWVSYTLKELGIPTLFAYGLTNKLNFSPKEKMFATLKEIGGAQESVTHDGTTLPKMHCDYMAGKYETAQEVHDIAMDGVDKLYAKNYFNSYFEYKVVRNAISAMFSPEHFVRHQYLIQPMIELLEQIDPEKCTLVIVSNWDQHSFKLFLETTEPGKKIAALFRPEDRIISGEIKANKPSQEFYDEIFRRYGSHDKERRYLFLDNELTNITVGKQNGLPSHHFTGDHKVEDVARVLRARGMIK